jgi:hypothetical protein
VANAHATDEPGYRVIVEDVPNHPIGFALEKAALRSTGDNTTCILTSVLQKRKALCNFRGNVHGWVMEEKTKSATHCLLMRKRD